MNSETVQLRIYTRALAEHQRNFCQEDFTPLFLFFNFNFPSLSQSPCAYTDFPPIPFYTSASSPLLGAKACWNVFFSFSLWHVCTCKTSKEVYKGSERSLPQAESMSVCQVCRHYSLGFITASSGSLNQLKGRNRVLCPTPCTTDLHAPFTPPPSFTL